MDYDAYLNGHDEGFQKGFELGKMLAYDMCMVICQHMKRDNGEYIAEAIQKLKEKALNKEKVEED